MTDSLMPVPILRWMKPVRMVMKMCVPSSSKIMMAPHEAIDGIDDVERAGGGGDSLRKSGERRDEERCKEILHGLSLSLSGRAHAFRRTGRGSGSP